MFDTVVGYGDKLVVWLAGLLLAAITAWVVKSIKSKTARELVSRALDEVVDAVQAVYQRFVSGMKAEGTFSRDAAKLAFEMAMREAKSNIGAQGLRRLARIVGVDVDRWLGTKVESAVAEVKKSIPKALVSSPIDTAGGAGAGDPPPPSPLAAL